MRKIILANLEGYYDWAIENNLNQELWITDILSLFSRIRRIGEKLKYLPSINELLLWVESLVKLFPGYERPLFNGKSY